MKRKFALFLALLMTLCFSTLAYATQNYVSVWSIEVKNQDGTTNNFEPGDLIEVSIVNSRSLSNIKDSVIHFTFNTDLIEYVSTSDFLDVQNYFGVTLSEPYIYTLNQAGVANTNNAGIFTSAFVSNEGISLDEGDTLFKVYFKVKTEVFGVPSLNFRWIKKGIYTSYIADTADNNINVNFRDAYLYVKGTDISDSNETLPGGTSYFFTPTIQPDQEKPEKMNINGTVLNIDSPYFVVFSRLVTRNSALKEAGILISKTEKTNMMLGDSGILNRMAINIGSDNYFGFIVYGTGIREGNSYYARAYATYEDDVTIYGDIMQIEIAEDIENEV